GRLGLEYSAQYFYNGSGTNGSLDFGRTVGTPESAATVDDVRRLATASGRLAQLARDLLALAARRLSATNGSPLPPSAVAFVDARGPPPRSAALV
ncbi:MAG: hypothetical protein LC659_15945, partial [Myxococcales bacterium]|nr:hypothetical protein [Myxococcales bacterium]